MPKVSLEKMKTKDERKIQKTTNEKANKTKCK